MRVCENPRCDNEFEPKFIGLRNEKRFCSGRCAGLLGTLRWKKKYPEKYMEQFIRKYHNDPEFRYKEDLRSNKRQGRNMRPKTHIKHIMRILGDDEIETCEIHKS